jgi:hypothetical protein
VQSQVYLTFKAKESVTGWVFVLFIIPGELSKKACGRAKESVFSPKLSRRLRYPGRFGAIYSGQLKVMKGPLPELAHSLCVLLPKIISPSVPGNLFGLTSILI